MFVTLVTPNVGVMKKHYLLFLSLLFSIASFAQAKDKASSSLKVGDAKSLVSVFNLNTDMTILDQDDLFSKADAEVILNNFFLKNKPTQFHIIHEGKSSSGEEFIIGSLETENGNFRVSFYYKNVNGKELIQQFMIDNE